MRTKLIRVYEETYKELNKLSKETGLSIPKVVDFVVGNEKDTCATCGLLPAFHIFIFDHKFKPRK